MTDQVLVRRFSSDDGAALDTYLRIRAQVWPDELETLDDVRWEEATFPGQVWRFLALRAGEPMGAASTGRLHIYGPHHPSFWLGLWVPQALRGHGIGSLLFAATSEAARAAGKDGFQAWVAETEADGIRFLLHRGFVEIGRDKSVRLDLRGMTPPDPAPPVGFRLETLDRRPDLVAGVHAAAVEAFPAIPSATPIDPGSLEEFLAQYVDRAGIPKGAFHVAVRVDSGEVAGYASLKLVPGSTAAAYHDMTAVRPAFRGRGLATALKRATIRWAIEHGLEELRTGNDEGNAPMRAINARLGYRPRADYLALRGPLAGNVPAAGG